MTRISRTPLDQKELHTLFLQMNTLLSKLSKKKIDHFFTELLGAEERIMLAKRLAIVIMLMEGNSMYAIADTLHVSTSTVSIQLRAYESGRYDNIVAFLKKNREEYEQLWKTLDVILRAGLPPRGKGRWKSVFQH